MAHETNQQEASTPKEKNEKISQYEEDKIKKSTNVKSKFNDWKFQIHWNILKWVNILNSSEGKNHFFV